MSGDKSPNASFVSSKSISKQVKKLKQDLNKRPSILNTFQGSNLDVPLRKNSTEQKKLAKLFKIEKKEQ